MKSLLQINVRLAEFSDKYKTIPLDKRHEFTLLKSPVY